MWSWLPRSQSGNLDGAVLSTIVCLAGSRLLVARMQRRRRMQQTRTRSPPGCTAPASALVTAWCHGRAARQLLNCMTPFNPGSGRAICCCAVARNACLGWSLRGCARYCLSRDSGTSCKYELGATPCRAVLVVIRFCAHTRESSRNRSLQTQASSTSSVWMAWPRSPS